MPLELAEVSGMFWMTSQRSTTLGGAFARTLPVAARPIAGEPGSRGGSAGVRIAAKLAPAGPFDSLDRRGFSA
jgi:hypothetical protein